MQPTILAKIFLVNERQQILTLTRSAMMSNRPGGIDIPGGHVDDGETFEQAVRREVFEETGIKPDFYETTLVYSHTEFIYGKNIIRMTYVGKLKADTIIKLSHEHVNYEWLSIDDSRLVDIPPGYRNGLEHAREHNLLPL